MTAVSELVIATDVSRWQRIGITVVDDEAQIGTVRLRFVSPLDRTGIVGWGLAGLPGPLAALDERSGEIDGVPTFAADAPADAAPAHRLGVVGFDHLVVMTSSLERTCAAIEQVMTSDRAALWGLVWNVEDIHEACAELGPDVVSLPKPAVQPGRLIASFREQAGLGLAVAMMSPGR